MRVRLFSIVIGFALAVFPLAAQDTDASDFVERVELAEDIETLSTILMENLQKCYATKTESKRKARGGGYGGGADDGGGGYGGAGDGGGEGGGYGGYGGEEGYGGGGGYGLSGGRGLGGSGGGAGLGGSVASGVYGGMGRGRLGRSTAKRSEISTPIAAYVPKTGVVITVDVPTPVMPWEQIRLDTTKDKSTAALEPPTRWQKAREKVSTDRIWAHGHWMTKVQCSNCHESLDFDSDASATSFIGFKRSLTTGPDSSRLVKAIADALVESAGNIRHLPESESITVVVRYRRWKDGLAEGKASINSLEFQSTAVKTNPSVQRLPASLTMSVPAVPIVDEEASRRFVAEAIKNVTFFDPGYRGELSLSELYDKVKTTEKKRTAVQPAARRSRGRGR